MRLFRRFPALALAVSLVAGCASPAPDSGLQRLEPGRSVEFDGRLYMLDRVQEDFVILRYREPGEGKGMISGYVEEVFRVSRYDLGEGRWYAPDRIPGAYLQWLGLDSFALAREPAPFEPSETVMAK